MTRNRWSDMLGAITLCAIVAGATWFMLDKERANRLAEKAQIETDFQLRVLHRDILLRVNSLRHIASLWRIGDFDADLFVSEAQDYIAQFPGVHAVRFADADLRLRFAAHRGEDAIIPFGTRIEELGDRRRTASRDAMRTGKVTITGAVDLRDGSGRGFIAFIPVFRNEEFLGLVTLAFNADAWKQDLLLINDHHDYDRNFASRIEISGATLQQDPEFNATTTPTINTEPIDLFGHDLRVQSRPTRNFTLANRDISPEVSALLLGGLLFVGYMQLMLLLRSSRAEARAAESNAKLREANAALALEVDDRRRAEAAARKSQNATSRFLTTMSHEIRTPLNAIMGMFQLIEAADIPERHRKQAAAGYASSQRLFRGLTNVLEVSRLDAGALTIVEDTALLAPLINGWQATLEGMVIRSGKPLQMQLDLGDDLPETIRVDAGRVTQIVTNLLDNAVRFTAEGGITLSVRRAGRGRDDLKIQVIDTGKGIPEDRKHTIFKRFYQLDNGLARQHQGSGLGLSICREIARLMGATLTHANRVPLDVGSGSTFTLRLHNVAKDRHSSTQSDMALGEVM